VCRKEKKKRDSNAFKMCHLLSKMSRILIRNILSWVTMKEDEKRGKKSEK